MDKAKNKEYKIFHEIVNHIIIEIEKKVNLSSYEVKQDVNRGIRQELVDSKKSKDWHFDSDNNKLTEIKEAGNQGLIKFRNVLNLAQDKFNSKMHASLWIFNTSLDLIWKRLQEDINSVTYTTIKDLTFPSYVIQLKKYLHRNINAVNQEHSRFNESMNQALAEFKELVNEIGHPVRKRENQISGFVQNPINHIQTGKFISSTFSNQNINDFNANRSLSQVQSTQYLNVPQFGSLSFYRFNNTNAAGSNIAEPTTYADYKSENESIVRTPEIVSNFTTIPTNNQPVNTVSTLSRKRKVRTERKEIRKPLKSNEIRTTADTTSVPESGNKFRNIQLKSVSYVGPSLQSTAACCSSASSMSNQSIRNTEEESACPLIEQINNPSFSENNNQAESKDAIKCPVCFDTVRVMEEENKKLLSTSCGHLFCEDCIKKQKRCPMCQRRAMRPFRFVYL